MTSLDTEQHKEMNDLGFTNPVHRRGLIAWFLAVSVGCNILLVRHILASQNANEKVIHEMIEKQFETKQKVDSTINSL